MRRTLIALFSLFPLAIMAAAENEAVLQSIEARRSA